MASLRRINQDDLRNHNLSVVIDTLLRASDADEPGRSRQGDRVDQGDDVVAGVAAD
ncbi:MAG: hypothetical protein V9G11_09340 [Bifidobacterium adolescentis]